MLEEKVGYHGDGDDLVGLIDDLGDLLVLDAHHVLAVHLFVRKGRRGKKTLRSSGQLARKREVGFVFYVESQHINHGIGRACPWQVKLFADQEGVGKISYYEQLYCNLTNPQVVVRK